MIFDTNVLIYLSKFILDPKKLLRAPVSISVITKIEALGYSFKNIEEHITLKAICEELSIVPLTDAVAEETIRLRSNHKIKLPDAIIYAAAFVKRVPLITNDISDFKFLGDRVELINPFHL